MSLITVDKGTTLFQKTFILDKKFINFDAVKDSTTDNYYVTIRTLFPCGGETKTTKRWSLEKLNNKVTQYNKRDVGHSFKSLTVLERNPNLYSSYCGLPSLEK